MTTSEKEIEKWSSIITRQGDKGRDRMHSYICSRALGRKFLEDPEIYFARCGLTEFVRWAKTA